MKTFKKLDFIIIITLFVLSFVPHFIFGIILSKNYDSTYAVIEISGEHYKSIHLYPYSEDGTFIIKTPYGNNTVTIKDGSVQITEADCNDDLCVKQGKISKIGESIVCLPHKLIIEIKGDKDSSSDDMILSY